VTRAQVLIAARVLAVLVLAVGAFAAAWFATDATRTEHRTPAPTPPRAYLAAGATPTPEPAPTAGPVPLPALVAGALANAVRAPQLGTRLLGTVVDVASGQLLYARGATATAAPASTAKLLTAAALLAVKKVTDRITTTVVAGTRGRIVLVGGGDPTLSGAPAGTAPQYPDAARLSDLAEQLRAAQVPLRGIVVDDSLFAGPSISPAWAPEDVPSFYASAITPVLADGGKAYPADYGRSATPDLDAGHELAALLGRPGLPVTRGVAPPGARELARVESAPIGTLVEQMLQQSDNVIAECMARQVALAEHQPASFRGAAHAIRTVLRRLGTDPGGGLVDGSGLAARDRLSPAGLVGVLRLMAGSTRPALHSVLAGMPVAGWSGTLADRYLSGASRVAAGVVRAKTGTLTGVSTLAGLVHDKSGRLLAFAFLADGVPSTYDADRALDLLAGKLATCGCS
jgi:D-alanyl-D-alanine carboxypeptidase/D-alanyl-D-alanine-endopeptidase (penicillin-binding protein 4)